MKTKATKFFQEYFKINDEEIELYDDTIDCMVKFAESVNNSDAFKMSNSDIMAANTI